MEINLLKIRESNIARIKDNSLIDLPLLDLKKINFRDKNEVAFRAIILRTFNNIALFPEDRADCLEWLKVEELYQDLSDLEKSAIKKSKFSTQENIDFNWYEESLTAILWVLGFVEKLDDPTKEFDLTSHFNKMPPEIEVDDYFDNISSIPKEDIIKELDYYYLVHWLARRNSKKYNLSVVIERRKALEWIVDESLDWDDVSLDT